MLALDDVTFAYPGASSPYRFDLMVEPGTILGLTGPSGSGKSTLLDLVAGFLTPQGGDITLDGTSLLPLPPERRPVSILFQSDNLFAHLPVAENTRLGVPREAARPEAIADALERMGLPAGIASRRAATLSGGQKQRVALARTLLRDKPVLLLDEPFTGIDAEAVAPIRQLIAELVQARQWHGILVSHDEADIEALATSHYRLVGTRTEKVR